MWELIRANKRKSVVIYLAMAVCLLALGYVIGTAVEPLSGGWIGFLGGLGLWGMLSFISFAFGDSILLASSGAKEVTPEIHPQLFNIVEEMTIAANLRTRPRIFIIDDSAPNAFATGRKPETSAIAVTAGLLERLNRDELQGVIAHEMSHILNRDILYVTSAATMLGSIVIVSHLFLRGLRGSVLMGRRSRFGSACRPGGGQFQIVFLLTAVVFAVLAPLFARILYFALSRQREYLADASGVRLTRYPEGLASALQKISSSHEELSSANQATAPMYIVSPFRKKSAALRNPVWEDGLDSSASFTEPLETGTEDFRDLTATHPPTSERIRILRGLANGVGFAAYQEAFSKVKNTTRVIIPPSGLKDMAQIPIRQASPETAEEKSKKDERRNVGDLIRALNQFYFLACSCGLRVKIPSDFKQDRLICPRCLKQLVIPRAQEKISEAVVAGSLTAGAGAGALEYARKGAGWETFFCSCGKPLQLSPLFCASYVTCKSCGRKTEIRHLQNR